MNKLIHFSELKNNHCVLTDASSVYPLSQTRILEFLTTNPDKKGRFKSLGYDYQQRWAVNLLGRMVVYDFLAVDSIALTSLGIKALPFPEFIKAIKIPDEIYEDVFDKIAPFYEKYGSHDLNHWMTNITIDDGFDKDYHEKIHMGAMSALLASSDQTALRTFFYLELAKVGEIALSLNPCKEKWFKFFANHIRPEVFRIIQSKVDKVMLNTTKRLVSETYNLTYKFPFPPLIESIFKIARQEKISLFDSVCKIRETTPAKSFRKWLSELQKISTNNPTTGLNKAAREIQGLLTLVKDWEKLGDTKINRNYKIRNLKVRTFPTIGWIFKLFEIDHISIKDPILTSPPQYFNFIASWYD